jgi:hypothetical protein
VLRDGAMSRVTAGQQEVSGGVIVGNSSDSEIFIRSGIDLVDEAQAGSRGLNVVNSADSTTANTVNIWRGDVVSFTAQETSGIPELEVNQINQIVQQQFEDAGLSGYLRPEAEWVQIERHSGSQSDFLDLVNINQVIDRVEEVRYSETTSDAMVDTRLELELDDRVYIRGHLGQGVATSGTLDATFDGGAAEFALAINGGISASAGISVTSGILGTSASLNAEASAEVGLSLLTSIELPRMEIELSGAGCGVVLGSCSASGSSSELVMTSSDHSTLDVHEYHHGSISQYSDESVSVYRSSFALQSAEANYIVIDDSSLLLDSELSLELSESAQEGAEAMNLVNAIASEVANAVNISRASHFENVRSRMILNQFNVVRHGQ